MTERPAWLLQAWAIRAVLLSFILGLLGLGLAARTGGGFGTAVLCILVIGAALWADWLWLGRNHHRVNAWGLSKGKDARKKPK